MMNNNKNNNNNNNMTASTKQAMQKCDHEKMGALYKVAARNLREYHGVPSMTAVNLKNTMGLLQLPARRLVAQGLAPQRMLKGVDGPSLPMSGGSSDGELNDTAAADVVVASCPTADESDSETDDEVWDDSNSDSSNYNKEDDVRGTSNVLTSTRFPIHAALVAGGIKLRPRETRPMLAALAVRPRRLVQLGLLNREALADAMPDWRARGRHHGRGMGRPCGPPRTLPGHHSEFMHRGHLGPAHGPPQHQHRPRHHRQHRLLHSDSEGEEAMYAHPGPQHGPRHRGGARGRPHGPPHGPPFHLVLSGSMHRHPSPPGWAMGLLHGEFEEGGMHPPFGPPHGFGRKGSRRHGGGGMGGPRGPPHRPPHGPPRGPDHRGHHLDRWSEGEEDMLAYARPACPHGRRHLVTAIGDRDGPMHRHAPPCGRMTRPAGSSPPPPPGRGHRYCRGPVHGENEWGMRHGSERHHGPMRCGGRAMHGPPPPRPFHERTISANNGPHGRRMGHPDHSPLRRGGSFKWGGCRRRGVHSDGGEGGHGQFGPMATHVRFFHACHQHRLEAC